MIIFFCFYKKDNKNLNPPQQAGSLSLAHWSLSLSLSLTWTLSLISVLSKQIWFLSRAVKAFVFLENEFDLSLHALQSI